MSSHEFDDSLLAGLRQHDQLSWQLFYEQLAPRLYNYIQRQTDSVYDAEDIVQETMLAAFGAFSGYAGQSKPFTWLCGIAKNKIADHYRRRKLASSLSSSLSLPAPGDNDTELDDALSMLPSDYRAALALRYYEGFSVGEIASQMGRSYKATESLLSRAREALRGELGKC